MHYDLVSFWVVRAILVSFSAIVANKNFFGDTSLNCVFTGFLRYIFVNGLHTN